MTIKKILYRLKSDSVSVLGWRTIFFAVRKILEAEREARFLLAKLGRRRITKIINGSKFELNLTDRGLAKDLLLAGIREPQHTELMKQAVRSGDIVLDIGANIGYYALLESRLVGATGLVYALEPVKANYENLKRNIALNQVKNIKPLRLAAGDKTGQAEIYLSRKSNWCSLRPGERLASAGKTEQTKVVTVDDFIIENKMPALIRMDVEGYEGEIIAGMKKTMALGAPLKIIIELHCFILSDHGAGLVKNLLANGFTIERLFRDCCSLMLGRSVWLKTFYYYLGKKINGVYEFNRQNVTYNDFIKLLPIIKNESAHVYFVRK